MSGTRWDSSLDAGERRAKPAVPSSGRALKTRGRPPLAPHLACEGFVQSRRAAEKPPRAEPGQSASCLVLGVPSPCLAVERARPTGCLRAASTAPCGLCIFRAPAKRPCLGAVAWRPSEARTSAARGPRALGSRRRRCRPTRRRRVSGAVSAPHREAPGGGLLSSADEVAKGIRPPSRIRCRMARFCYSPEEAKNDAPCREGDQRDAVAQGVNGLHQDVERDLQRKKKRCELLVAAGTEGPSPDLRVPFPARQLSGPGNHEPPVPLPHAEPKPPPPL